MSRKAAVKVWSLHQRTYSIRWVVRLPVAHPAAESVQGSRSGDYVVALRGGCVLLAGFEAAASGWMHVEWHTEGGVGAAGGGHWWQA